MYSNCSHIEIIVIKHSGSLIALALTNTFSSLFIQFLIQLLAVFGGGNAPAVQRLEVAL